MDIERFRKIVGEVVQDALREGLLSGLTHEDVKYAAHLADHVNEGKMSAQDALDELKRYSVEKGYAAPDSAFFTEPASREEYLEAVGDGEMVDVTDKVKAALIEAGEPGLADAFVEIKVPRDHPPTNGAAAVAISAKGWFSWEGVHPYETGMIQRAIKLAAESEGITWMP